MDTDFVLGIEAGGTRTVAVAIPFGENEGSTRNVTPRRIETGPANVRLVNDKQLVQHFKEIARAIPTPASIAIGMAGARSELDWERIRRAAGKVWPGVPCYATNDLETALMAAEDPESKSRVKSKKSGLGARVLVLSGTGSCCFGKLPSGKTAKVGGWGHLLGDKGSGYEIGLRALKAVVYYYDSEGRWSPLGQRILRALQLNEPNDLIGWVQNAGKDDIAALAVEVFTAAKHGDKIAVDILTGAASRLAADAAACAKRLVRKGGPAQFILAGSVLLKQPAFARQVGKKLRKLWPTALITALKRESVWGAVELAKQHARGVAQELTLGSLSVRTSPSALRTQKAEHPEEIIRSLVLSPTEQRNPLSMNLHRLPLEQAIVLMLKEDAKIPAVLLEERKNIEQLIEFVVGAFRRGGRLFYVGAGTSGRLGILDASECPPTFRTPPELVQGIIAGGQRAIWEAVEGAEDDPVAGARAVEFRAVGAKDVVVGIAASGRTPFVWGALLEARPLKHGDGPQQNWPWSPTAPVVTPMVATFMVSLAVLFKFYKARLSPAGTTLRRRLSLGHYR